MSILKAILRGMKNFFGYFISKVFLKNILAAIVLIAIIIWFTFFSLDSYTRHGESHTVPDFYGLTVQESQRLAKVKKMKVEVIDSVFNPRGKKGAVVEQTPLPKFRVKENRTIFLTVNAYMQEQVIVPRVIDVSVIQARQDLESSGLKVGQLKFVESDFQKLVLAQEFNGHNIAAGSKVPKNSAIDLIVGLGKEESITFIPRFSGLTLEIAKDKAIRALVNIGECYYDRTVKDYKDSLNAKVWQQEPFPKNDNEVEYGTQVDLWFTTNENKVRLSIAAEEESISSE